MMKSIKHNLIFTFMILMAFLLTPFFIVFAQEEGVDSTASVEQSVADETATGENTEEVSEPVVVVAPTITDEEAEEAATEAGESVIEDEAVTAQDLGIEEPKILPGDFRYPFKNLWRGIKTATTFNNVKKAELRLQHANERIIEAQLVVEEKGDEVSARHLNSVMKKYEKDLSKVQKAMDKVEDKIDNNPKLENFINKLVNTEIKRHKIIQKLEGQVPEKAIENMLRAKENSAQNFGKVIEKLVPKEQIVERMNDIIENQEGSKFKDFTNLQIIKEIKEGFTDDMKEEFEEVEGRMLERIEDKFKRIDIKEREEMKRYFEKMHGNEVTQIKMFDDLENKIKLPIGMLKDFDDFKESAVKRFEERIGQFEDEEIRERFLDPFKDGDTEDVRAMMQLRDHINPEFKAEMDKAHDESIAAFKAKFFDDDNAQATADKFKILTKKMEENPDPVTFATIQELEKSLSPEQQKFIEELKEKTGEKFEEKMRIDRERFLSQISSNDPSSLERLEELRDFVPVEARYGIDQAKERQLFRIQEHIGEFDDAEHFLDFRERLEGSEALAEIINRRPDFKDVMKREQLQAIDNNLKRFDDPKEMLRFRDDFEDKMKRNPEFEKIMQEEHPDLFKQINEKQFRAMETKIQGFNNPEAILEFKKRIDREFEDNPELKQKILGNRPDFIDNINRQQVEAVGRKINQIDDPERLRKLKEELNNGFKDDFQKYQPGIFEEVERFEREKQENFDRLSDQDKQRIIKKRENFDFAPTHERLEPIYKPQPAEEHQRIIEPEPIRQEIKPEELRGPEIGELRGEVQPPNIDDVKVIMPPKLYRPLDEPKPPITGDGRSANGPGGGEVRSLSAPIGNVGGGGSNPPAEVKP